MGRRSWGGNDSLSCGTRIPFSLDATSSAGEFGASFVVDVGKNTTTASASGLPLTIPKNSSTGVTSQVQVAESFTVRNVTVDVDLAHGNVGELTVQLRSPTNTVVTLHAKSRAGQANLVANFDVDRAPDGPGTMNDFDGKSAQGTWSLLVVDDVSGSTPPGSERGFTLRFEATAPISCTPCGCGEPTPGAVGTSLSIVGADGTIRSWTPTSATWTGRSYARTCSSRPRSASGSLRSSSEPWTR